MTLNPMLLLIPFVLFLSILYQFDVTAPLKPTAERLHAGCVGWFSDPYRPRDLSASFICGKKVTHTDQKNLLQKSGLYHAIVVSGGHFLFLESFLKRARLPYLLRMIILLTYYLITNLQAPGLRCLMQLNLSNLKKRWDLKTSQPTLCFYSGLVCLMICSDLWTSLSFWLSFAVSMSLAYSHELESQKRSIKSFLMPLFCIYIFLIPFNFTNGYLHPLNLIFGAVFLYPFCLFLLLAAFFVVLQQVTAVTAFDSILEQLSEYVFLFLKYTTQIVPIKNFGKFDPFYLWIYLLFLILVFHVFTMVFRRETIRE